MGFTVGFLPLAMISLKIIQLSKSYGPKRVFSDVSFEHEGSSLGIAGSNGSGKSTFLKCLGNLLRPSSGRVEWSKEGNLLGRDELQPILGYAAPYINLYDELSCRENLHFLANIRHQDNAESAIEQWIPEVGLSDVADQPYGKLSTGQQQRLRLASALFHRPDILLLDEPGSNLDEAGRSLIAAIAKSFQSQDKLLIIASNNPNELDLCERIFSIEEETFA